MSTLKNTPLMSTPASGPKRLWQKENSTARFMRPLPAPTKTTATFRRNSHSAQILLIFLYHSSNLLSDRSYFFFHCHISYIKLLTLILQYLFHFAYLFWINADFCIFIYCFHNLFHILFFHCNTTSRIRIASCTM